MTASFYDSHLDTLVKLKALVEKHGMKIRFGTNNNHMAEADLSLLDDYADKELLESLGEYYNDIIDGDIMMLEEKLWFELYDPQPGEKHGKCHMMIYTEKNTTLRLKDDWEDSIDNMIEDIKEEYTAKASATFGDEEDELDEEGVMKINQIELLRNWIEEKEYEHSGVVEFSDNSTVMSGFGFDKLITDHRVYREGMALHSFTELVCEYLKEPMIRNTY